MAKVNQAENSEMKCKTGKAKKRRQFKRKMVGQSTFSSSSKGKPSKKNTSNEYLKLTNAQKFEADIKILEEGIQSYYMNQGRFHQSNKAYCFNVFKRIISDNYLDSLVTENKELDKRFQVTKQKLVENIDQVRNTLGLTQSVHCKLEAFDNCTGFQKKFLSRAKRKINSFQNLLTAWEKGKSEFSTIVDSPEVSTKCQLPVCNSGMDEKKPNDYLLKPESFTSFQKDACKKNFARCFLSNTDLSSQIQPDVNEEQYLQNNSFKPNLSSINLIDIKKDGLKKDVNQLEFQAEELKGAKEEVFQLLKKLKETQDELETVRKEMNEKINNFQENADSEQKKMVVQLTEIRKMLKDKFSSNNQIDPVFDNCLKGVTCQGILWDIRWLVDEVVQLKIGTEVTGNAIPPDILKVTQNEMHVVILIACLLKVFPFAVSTEFIHSYIRAINTEISHQDVESLMTKFPTVFRGECVAVKPLEKKWRYLNFSPVITI